jgi:hypothetical protein
VSGQRTFDSTAVIVIPVVFFIRFVGLTTVSAYS